MTAISATIPVLASLNIEETAAFYELRLGFESRLRSENYLIMERDGCELHFWLCGECHIAENTSCCPHGDTEVLHADFARRGLKLDPPVARPWGMREFYVIAPHGNLLKIGEPN